MAVMVLAVLLLLAIAGIVGLFTPIVAFMAMVAQFGGSWDLGVSSTGFVTISILNALALMLPGSSAYPLDALRFGRRVVYFASDDGDFVLLNFWHCLPYGAEIDTWGKTATRACPNSCPGRPPPSSPTPG
jgi:hypothetical protein